VVPHNKVLWPLGLWWLNRSVSLSFLLQQLYDKVANVSQLSIEVEKYPPLVFLKNLGPYVDGPFDQAIV